MADVPTRKQIAYENWWDKKLFARWEEAAGLPEGDLDKVYGRSKILIPEKLYRPVQKAAREGKNLVVFTLGPSSAGSEELVYRTRVGEAPMRAGTPSLPLLEKAKLGKASEPFTDDFASCLRTAMKRAPLSKSQFVKQNAQELIRQEAILSTFKGLGHWSDRISRTMKTVWIAMDFGDGDVEFFGAWAQREYVWLCDLESTEYPKAEFAPDTAPISDGPLRSDLGPFDDNPVPKGPKSKHTWWAEHAVEDPGGRMLARTFARYVGMKWEILEPVWSRSRGIPLPWLDTAIRKCVAAGAPVLLIYATDGGAGAGSLDPDWWWIQHTFGSYESEKWTEPADPIPWDFGNQLALGNRNGEFAKSDIFEQHYQGLAELDAVGELARRVVEWSSANKLDTPLRIDIVTMDDRIPVAELGPGGVTVRVVLP